MKLLVDTHAYTDLYISTATVWELAVKASIKRLTLSTPVERFISARLEEGYRLLPVEWRHAAAVEGLPFHHRDPFDRLLAVQVITEQMSVVTRDAVM